MIERIYPATIASFATSVSVDLGKPYGSVFIEVPTMASQTAWSLSTSTDGSIYRKVNVVVNSSTLQFASYTVGSAITGVMLNAPAGFRYYKIDTTAVVSFTAGFKFICYEN